MSVTTRSRLMQLVLSDGRVVEQAVGVEQKSAMSLGGSLGGPLTAFQYDWNMLPIGQQMWLEHLSSYEKFPPLQAAESYNLSQVLEQVKAAKGSHASE